MDRKKKRRLLLAALGAVALALLVWRLWPRSLYEILDTEAGTISSLSVAVSEPGVADGISFINTSGFSSLSAGDSDFSAVLSILEDTQYRPDLRNLLPWGLDSVDSGGGNIKYSATLGLRWGDESTDGAMLVSGKETQIAVGLDTADGFLIFHPTDRGTLERLAAYVMEHGEAGNKE